MVFPIAHEKYGPRTIPWMNYAIIAANLFVFLVFQKLGNDEDFTYKFSVVPEKIVTGRNLNQTVEIVNPMTNEKIGEIKEEPTPGSVYLTLLTSMFMHGGILHILGNMWFLWVFGDDIEAVFGKLWYLVFYLASGVLASLAHVYVTYALSSPGDPSMMIPSLGASGAISGVLGAYIIRFPTKRVTVILFRFLTQVPAWAAIGIWFLFQIVNSLGMLGGSSQAGGGVAYAAHVGGFACGAVVMLIYNLIAPEPPRTDYENDYPTHRRREPWDQY